MNLDPYSENILFECERCRRVGEMTTHLIWDEEELFCWNCVKERILRERERTGERTDRYALKP